MKYLKHITILIFILVTTASCIKKENTTEKATAETNTEQKLENLEVTIEGMTCEIGCAKFITSKTSKLNGVNFASVNFEHKLGQFTYDTNVITKDELISSINNIAGGEQYTVTTTNNVEEFQSFE